MNKTAEKSKVLDYACDSGGLYGIVARSPSHEIVLAARPDVAVKYERDRCNFERRQQSCGPSLFHTIPRAHGWRLRKTGEGELLRAAIEGFRGNESLEGRKEFESTAERTAFFRHLFGLKGRAGAILNGLLKALYEKAVPPEYLRIIRRYPIGMRAGLYPGLCEGGPRAWQLAEVFPELCVYVYGRCHREWAEQTKRVRAMVERGAALRDVAGAAGVPMSFRRFPPATLGHLAPAVAKVLANNHGLIENFAPQTVPRINAWLKAIAVSVKGKDPEFSIWVARHAMAAGHFREVAHKIADAADWVRASRVNRLISGIDPQQARMIEELLRVRAGRSIPSNVMGALRPDPTISRYFNQAMSLQTVMKLSDEWHRMVSKIKAEEIKFPAPWYSGGEVGGFTIEPLADHVALSAMARRFRNCAATYACAIAAGDKYLYTVSNGKPLAMAEVVVSGDKTAVGEIRGPYNSGADRKAAGAFRKWFRAQRKAHGNGALPEREASKPVRQPATADGWDDDIPF